MYIQHTCIHKYIYIYTCYIRLDCSSHPVNVGCFQFVSISANPTNPQPIHANEFGSWPHRCTSLEFQSSFILLSFEFPLRYIRKITCICSKVPWDPVHLYSSTGGTSGTRPSHLRRSMGATWEAKRVSMEQEFARKEHELREEQAPFQDVPM